MLDVLIITYNEKLNLPHCLESLVGWTNQVFVVDSCSTDQTQAIAKKFGVYLAEQPWPGYAQQRNWALHNLPFKANWVLILDADEVITKPLRQRIQAIVEMSPAEISENGFFINRLTYFLGQPIKHCGYYPSWNLRLMKRGAGVYENRRVHEHMIIPDPVSYIREPIIHRDRRGLEHAVAKHNRYSSLEAEQLCEELQQTGGEVREPNLTRETRRRRWLKRNVSHRVPFLAFWRFVYMYVFRLGVLDGRVGLDFCRFIATYDAMVAMKLRWLLRGAPDAQPAPTGTHSLAVPQNMSDPSTPVVPTGGTSQPTAAEGSALKTTNSASVSPSGRDQGGEACTASGEADSNQPRAYPIQHRPESSPWSSKEKIGRGLWMVVGRPMFRLSFHNWHALRRGLLRLFGARIGQGVAIRPTVSIEVPWMIDIDDYAVVGDHAILYSLGRIYIGKRTIISQYSHLCAGTHDHTDHRFPLVREPITVGDDVWIGADAFVGPAVCIGNLAVLGARSSAFKDLPPKKTCVGSPAKPIKERVLR
jgi:acetyltransferase-like isoleucine patch superfamily enzyme/glycosyltransferase involved in cell wall biosynthesis